MTSFQRRLLPSTASLTAFDAVARLGSFTAAAAALDLTPGAVSRQMSVLENQLGVALLSRTNKGVELTGKGAIYARDLSEVLSKIRTMSLGAISQADTNGLLSLAVLPTFGTRWLLPRLPDFVRRFPEITLNLSNKIGRVDLEAEGLHAAIHVGLPDWPGCDFHLLMREEVVPVCSPDFLARYPVGQPEELLTLPLLEIASREGHWQRWFDSLEIKGTYRKGMRFEQLTNVCQACCAGLGIALMPTFLIENELESQQLIKVYNWPIESPGGYYYVHRKNIDYVPTLKFLSWITDQRELRGRFERG